MKECIDKYVAIYSNGIDDITIWKVGNENGLYMVFEDETYRLQINEKTKHILQGYTKLEKPRVIDTDKVLNVFNKFYIKHGYYISGSINLDYLMWKFPDISEEALSDILHELVMNEKLQYKSTLGGPDYILKGKLRVELIEKNDLLPKWKDITKESHMGFYAFEKEYECAKEDIRHYTEY